MRGYVLYRNYTDALSAAAVAAAAAAAAVAAAAAAAATAGNAVLMHLSPFLQARRRL